MMLTSLQLKEFVNAGQLDPNQIQQVSIDLKIAKIEKLSSHGVILKEKSIIPTYQEVEVQKNYEHNVDGWYLDPGYYGFTFSEGVKVPVNVGLLIIQRSSLLRSGVVLTSSIWDPNFETKMMGSFATVNKSIFIEREARVACMYGWYCAEVSEDLLYKGQFQGK